jgi:ubiquinone biosynthesis protein Coq4
MDSDSLKPLPRQTIGKLYEEALKLTEYDAKEIEALAKKSDATGG